MIKHDNFIFNEKEGYFDEYHFVRYNRANYWYTSDSFWRWWCRNLSGNLNRCFWTQSFSGRGYLSGHGSPVINNGRLALLSAGPDQYKSWQPNIDIGHPCVIIGSLLSSYIPNSIYAWLIGVILILLGLSMFLQNRNKSAESKAQTVNTARLKAGLYGILGGLMVGVAGMSGGAVILAGLFFAGPQRFQGHRNFHLCAGVHVRYWSIISYCRRAS